MDVICRHCHNDKRAPTNVISQADVTLKRLKVVRTYLAWWKNDPTHRPLSDKIAQLELNCRKLTKVWHRFDLAGTDEAADKLLAEIEKAFDADGVSLAVEGFDELKSDNLLGKNKGPLQ